MIIILNIARYLVLFVLVTLFAALFAHQSWYLYDSIFHEPGGSWLDLSDIAGLILGYVFLMPLLLKLLGERHSHWLIIILYIPILLFELNSNFTNFGLFLSLGTSGFLLGWLIRFAIANTPLGKMQVLAPLKKYF